MSSTRFVYLVSFLAGSSQARTFARLVTQERAAYEGGWALGIPGTTCPADAPVACPINSGSVNPTCCPTGQTCYGTINPHCCPSNSDCSNVVENFPVCGNSTWNMYELNLSQRSFFCCEPGQVGVLPITGYAGICEPADQQIASSLIATPASQVGGAAVTTPVAPAGTSQSTLTSTLTNGGVTTITTAVAGSTATATTTTGVAGGYTPPSHPENSVYVTGLSTGAKIGLAIAFGVAVILLIAGIVWCYRRRRARREQFQAALLGAGYNNGLNQSGQPPMQQGQGQPQTPAPQYMQTPPQPYSSPISEYKNPSVAVFPTGYAHSSPSPVQTQGSYVPPTPQYPGGPEPVEAPQAWERGVELGPGK